MGDLVNARFARSYILAHSLALGVRPSTKELLKDWWGSSSRENSSHRGWDMRHYWPTGRAAARAPGVGRAACGGATTIAIKSLGDLATRLRRSSVRRSSCARSEARPGVGVLHNAGVLTIAEADAVPGEIRGCSRIVAAQLSSRR